MADWPVLDATRYDSLPTGANTAVTASATINTKGSWVEMWASIPWDIDAIGFHALPEGAEFLVDFGIGAAGSEVVLVPDIYLRVGSAFDEVILWCPLHLAEGTRIAFRCQATVGSAICYSRIYIMAGGFPRPITLGRATSYGTTAASTAGVTLTSGLSGVEGAWAELTASSANPIRCLVVSIGRISAANNSRVDIGVGASGSEVILVPDLQIRTPSIFIYFVPVTIPSATRIAARLIADADSVQVELALVGFD